jgi:hypothetical protein
VQGEGLAGGRLIAASAESRASEGEVCLKNEKAINEFTTSRAGSAPLPIVKGRRTSRRLLANGTSAERVRQSIKAGMLVKTLQDIADGKKDAQAHQVTAALGLLRKVLPDLQATLISGDPQLPLTIITRLDDGD